MKTLGIVCVVSLGMIALIFSGGGCGSGGGGGGGGGGLPPAGPALFDSVNFLVGIQGDNIAPAPPPPMTVTSAWGNATSDGAGNFTAALLTMANATMDLFGWTYIYDVSADRVVTWQLFAGTDLFRGGISADGRVSAVGSVQTGSLPSFFVTLRRAGSFNLASLNGDYHICGWDGGLTTHKSYWGQVSFDGAGLLDFTLDRNVEGLPPGLPITGVGSTYSVAPGGAVTLTLGGGMDLAGGMLDGGDLVILGGSVIGTTPRIFVLIRESSAATSSTFNGSYFFVGISRETPLGGYQSMTGTLVADPAAGTIDSVTTEENEDGVLMTVPPGVAMSYTVSPSGLLTVTEPSGPTDFVGGVSPGGEFAVIAGGVPTLGNDPQIIFLVR